MDITFMTIHNLTSDANIMFASDSVLDILGFQPDEVVGKPCFDYFHPEDVPFARYVHNRGVLLDRAAALHYTRIKHKNGQWIDCECVFTVVYQVITACTSIYRGDARNRKRAEDAPAVRRLFSSSRSDPRYLMFEHISQKFNDSPQQSLLEVRAALIVNRFTRTLTVMYATNAISSILGITPEQFKGKSFYECMQENCLPEAIRCIESAKANDSIAYLRFWARDPRRQEDFDTTSTQSYQSGTGIEFEKSCDDDSDSYIPSLKGNNAAGNLGNQWAHCGRSTSDTKDEKPYGARRVNRIPLATRTRSEPYELEAVVSCTSDGLVVVLRRVLSPEPPAQSQGSFFAAPWGINHSQLNEPELATSNFGTQFICNSVGNPTANDFMTSIQDVVVFAWKMSGPGSNISVDGDESPQDKLITLGHVTLRQADEQPNSTLGLNNRVAPGRASIKKIRTIDQELYNKTPSNNIPKDSLDFRNE
ncbi:hypothetical protein K3495_g11698 [Podosphaera aphanis]|nr:hypothetical protein K3495_g11698 [Podosphaera aphanis]